MKCIFCSMIYSDINQDISKTKNPKSISGHKFQCNLINGLINNGIDLEVYNTQRIRPFPYNSTVIASEKIIKKMNGKGINIKFINVPFINYISQGISLKKKLKKAIKKYQGERLVLLVFNTQYVQSKAVLSMKKRYPYIVTCNVVGDLYGKYGLKVTSKGLQKFWQRHIEKKQETLQSRFDKYVLLAPMMQQALDIKENDFVIVEGFYEKQKNEDITMVKDSSIDLDEKAKIIFYAGSLKRAYGIEHLIRAFQLVTNKDYYLYIAGSGDGEELIKKYAENDNRVRFLGFLPPDEVLRYQQIATVLVSPRLPNEEFVKYSFPSKTFECLASGKPYIAHRLPCEPNEYSRYIQYPDDESDEALCDEIVRVCEMSLEKRQAIANAAHDFIINEKNATIMCRRIVDLLNSGSEKSCGQNSLTNDEVFR